VCLCYLFLYHVVANMLQRDASKHKESVNAALDAGAACEQAEAAFRQKVACKERDLSSKFRGLQQNMRLVEKIELQCSFF
jgi:hypothetical protein